MKVARIRENNKIKEQKGYTNDEYSLKNMIIILLILSVIFVVFYFITVKFAHPKKVDEVTTPAQIDSNKITLGNLLDRPENEYYVLVTKESLYDSSANYTKIYDNYINDYQKDENALKIYRVNLDDALNKKYVSDKLNITDDLSTLTLNDEVLFKINNKKIEKYYVGNSKIVDKLSRLKS